jgi:hypothetical protein
MRFVHGLALALLVAGLLAGYRAFGGIGTDAGREPPATVGPRHPATPC